MSPMTQATEVILIKKSFIYNGEFYKVVMVFNKETGEYIKYFDCLKDKTTSPFLLKICDSDVVSV